MDRINKNLETIGLPLFATIASMIVSSVLLIKHKGFETFNHSPFFAIIASTLGIVVAFLLIKTIFKGREAKVFVIYSHNESELVKLLIRRLRSRRFTVLYDDEVVSVGDNIKEKIFESIKSADIILFILSDVKSTQNFLKFELITAIENNKKVLPVLVKQDTYVPEELKGIKYADILSDFDTGFRQILKSLLDVSRLDKQNLKLPD